MVCISGLGRAFPYNQLLVFSDCDVQIMTLISAYSINNIPILFGDLLTTGPILDNHLIVTPALGDISDFFGDSGWGVSRLRQKINLVSNTCAIAWAGEYIGAKVAIEGLRRLLSSGSITSDEIIRYLEAEPELRNHPAHFVGLNCYSGKIQQFRWHAKDLSTSSLGTVYMEGSGSHVIPEFAAFQANLDWDTSGNTNPLAQAIASGVNLGAILLQSEYVGGDNAHTILHSFGGGYEIAFASGGTIQKLPEITYMFWSASFIPEGLLLPLSPSFIVKQSYVDEYLLIQSAQSRFDQNTNITEMYNKQRHVISPLFQPKTQISVDVLNTLSFQSRFFCHCVSVYSGDRFLDMYNRIQKYASSSEVPIVINDTGDQLTLSFRQDLLVGLAKNIKEKYSAFASDILTQPLE